MLFVNTIANAQAGKDYFARALAHGDYYTRDGQELPGRWHGLGAEVMGLAGDVTQAQFFRLCDNRHPLTGERLTPRTKADRRPAWDLTFDAPKSVTLALELGGDTRVLEAFRAAVRDTMGEIEADVSTRVRRKGADHDRRTANLVWGEFVHRTARPVDGIPDPQLHCHAVVFNTTYDTAEDRWKAVQLGGIVRDKGYYQAAFHSRLAGRLQALGYGILRDGTSFALAGIDRQTVEKFSRRAAVIEAEAERRGIDDAAQKGELARTTREAKGEGESMDALRAQWDARLTGDERDALMHSRHQQSTTSDAREAVAYALAHSFERASVTSERRLVAEALMQGVGRSNLHEVWDAVRSADLLARDVDGQRFVTTKAVYREELAMVRFAREGRGKERRLGNARTPALDPELTAEQRKAALHLLRSRDTVMGLKGGAGTGKTRMMQATVAAIEQGGHKVFAFAPSAKASRGVLRSEGFAEADTVEKLLTDATLRPQIRGQVLWIDEAGLLSTRDMNRVFDLAKEEGCRVVLSGDSAQHSAVARGDALRLLEGDAGMTFARLKTIRRQTGEDYREAVQAIAGGDARAPGGGTQLAAGISRLDRMGALIEMHGEARHQQLAADYVTATSEKKRDGTHKTALVVSPTHREGEQVAAAIREALRRAGRLGSGEHAVVSLRPLNRTEAERGSAASYQAGDVVRFHQNARGFTRGERVRVTGIEGGGVRAVRQDGSAVALPLADARHFAVFREETLRLAAGDRLRITQNGYTREVMKAGAPAKSRLNNGDVYDIAGFTASGDIRLANGFLVPADYGGLAQGYVVTSHASQGATVDTALIALGRESLAAANRAQFYVSVSRGREAVRLYTDDKAALVQAVQNESARLSATELLQGRGTKRAPPDARARVIALGQVRRAYEAVRDRVRAFTGFIREPERGSYVGR